MKITVRVKCGVKKPSIKKNEDGSLEVAIHEKPIKGVANRAVLEALTDYFHTSRSCISILAGHTSKVKIIEIAFRPES